MKTALIIIFNHRYDANLEKLRTLYKNRFSKIMFLMPSYDGRDKDVVPVYESSFYFHGFISQAYSKIVELKCDYYFFIGDDLILHPKLNEGNIISELKIANKKVFMSSFDTMKAGWGLWSHWIKIFPAFKYNGLKFKNLLPSREYAYAKLNDFSNCMLPQYAPKPLSLKNFFKHPKNFREDLKRITDCLGLKSLLLFVPKIRNKLIEIPYPCIMGYSDYLLLRADALKPASDMFAVFAAMNLFVEIALPTTIGLSFKRNEVCFIEETNYTHGAIWNQNEIENLGVKNDFSIKKLFENWEDNKIYYHPIKLSKWNLD